MFHSFPKKHDTWVPFWYIYIGHTPNKSRLWNFLSAHSWKNIDTPLDAELGVRVCSQSFEIFFSRNIWNRDILRASICAYRHKLSFLLKKSTIKQANLSIFEFFQKNTFFHWNRAFFENLKKSSSWTFESEKFFQKWFFVKMFEIQKTMILQLQNGIFTSGILFLVF